MPVLRDDPYPALNFEVTIDGISDDGGAVKGSFSEVSGLEVEAAVIEYRNGSEPITPRKLPGLIKYTNITLKRGVIGDTALWNWMAAVLKGAVIRANGTIVLLNEQRQPVLVWKFRRGWPCKWSGPRLAGKDNAIALETLEICHEGLELEV